MRICKFTSISVLSNLVQDAKVFQIIGARRILDSHDSAIDASEPTNTEPITLTGHSIDLVPAETEPTACEGQTPAQKLLTADDPEVQAWLNRDASMHPFLKKASFPKKFNRTASTNAKPLHITLSKDILRRRLALASGRLRLGRY